MRFLFLFSLALFSTFALLGQGIQRQTLGVSGGSQDISIKGGDFHIAYSIGQGSVIGIYGNHSGELRQGFIQPLTTFGLRRQEVSELVVKVYPNPFTEDFCLEFEAKLECRIMLFDIGGRPVFESTGYGKRININPPALAKGTYILKIMANDGLFTGQIQKM